LALNKARQGRADQIPDLHVIVACRDGRDRYHPRRGAKQKRMEPVLPPVGDIWIALHYLSDRHPKDLSADGDLPVLWKQPLGLWDRQLQGAKDENQKRGRRLPPL
jgi:hypothetical protein